MVMFRTILLTLLFVPVAALAHQINGTLQRPNGQPIQNKDIEIRCPASVNAGENLAKTDNGGNFSFFISKIGRCTIVVDGAMFTVYSSQNPVRYDLILDGGALRRR